MDNVSRLKYILHNHSKLISMMNDKALPIKDILLKDVNEMKEVLESASTKQKENE